MVDKQLQPHVQKVSSTLEAIVLHVVKNDQHMYIVSVYRPPHCNISKWNKEISKILEFYQSYPVCVLGDFNEDIMLDGLHSGTLIDHVYTRDIRVENVHCGVYDCYYSDHDIVTCVIKCS